MASFGTFLIIFKVAAFSRDILGILRCPLEVHNMLRVLAAPMGRIAEGAGGVICPGATGSRGPHHRSFFIFLLQEMF